ncbi:MAG: hypothetical protein IT529_23655 [Burkholderiales bacterium]|nr:hypothetical protein [Burkholderiales bacterium]
MSAARARSPLHGRGAARLAGWFAAAQLIPLAAAPALTRLYSPEELGQWAIFAALIFIAGSAAPLRFEQVVLVARSRADGLGAALIALGCAGAGAALVWLAGAAGAYRAAVNAFGAGAAAWTWLLAPCVALLAAALVANGWLLREARFRAVGLIRVGQTAAASVLGVAFGLAGLPQGLVAAQFAGLLLTGGLSAGIVLRAAASSRWPRLVRLRALARRYRAFPVQGTPAVLLGTLGIYLPLLVFGRLFGEAENGQFALARQCLIAVVGVLTAATGQAFTLAATQCVRSRGSLAALLRRQLLRQCAIAAAFLAAAVLAAPALFGWFFGADWTAAGRYAAWLAVPLAAALLVSPVSPLLIAVERVGTNGAWQAGYVAALALLVLPSYGAPAAFLAALAAVEVACYAAYLALIVRAARNHDRAIAR